MQDYCNFQIAAAYGKTFCHCIGLVIQLLRDLLDAMCHLRIYTARSCKARSTVPVETPASWAIFLIVTAIDVNFSFAGDCVFDDAKIIIRVLRVRVKEIMKIILANMYKK